MKSTIIAASLVVSSGLSLSQTLPSEQRINGSLTAQAFEPVRQALQECTVIVYADERAHIRKIYGMMVSENGEFVTKASEIADVENLKARYAGKLYTELSVIGVDEDWDIALVKIVGLEESQASVMAASSQLPMGSWVISNGASSRERARVRVGVISANTREIPYSGHDLMLGVVLKAVDDGVQITELAEEGGAEGAGLQVGDQLVSVGDTQVSKLADLATSLKGCKAGDKITVKVIRDGEEVVAEVPLTKRPGGAPLTRNDQMSGQFSERREGFPLVIQHDTPLHRRSVGGALLNLDGECVGLNIARATREASYAIPAEKLSEIVIVIRNSH
ncbi:PDZ domain-containing protein [Persicirhabdus sediminis]|uniref:PDZ domain-containing protein n=1 Tax=Persicirhabdus sediminis TaxID=454144 RepID=A0A8J7SK93_9BACT|nr:PDZ domain-containing protein [Persicirhabdus sediminis]MBK1791591.1 PDZ domain-containing protein [Persicirhabdus sediminis]